MKVLKIYFSIVFISSSICFKAQQKKVSLFVAVVVDQMKYEYVDRFWDYYGEMGIKKITNSGAFCRNTHYNYIPTYTGPGHASIFTGTTPSVHGIIGNNWYDRTDFSPVYCAGDWKSQTVCLCKTPHDKNDVGSGQMSPVSLLCNTVGDQLKLSDSLSKVFGISIKDRGAILSSGALANGAYWLNRNAQWISSSFYTNELPSWISDFQNSHPAESYMKGHWKGKTFDYDLSQLIIEKGPSAIKSNPKGNDFTLDFAKRLILEENLGKDNHLDLLTLGFSSTDYIGHTYGPDAEEIKSTYIQFDKTLASLIDFLDEHIGIDNYTLMLTSDHGAGTSPNLIKDKRLKGGNFNSKEVKSRVSSALELSFGVDNLIVRYSNMQFYMNHKLLDSLDISFGEVYQKTREVLLQESSVKEVYNWQELNSAHPSLITKMLINGIHKKRSGDIFMVLNPGYIEWSSTKGTSHGTHYNYDTHVPLFFYGTNIEPNVIYDKVEVSDIAPTLSVLMNIGFPNACTGNPVVGVLK